jgi:hypothetical protein
VAVKVVAPVAVKTAGSGSESSSGSDGDGDRNADCADGGGGVYEQELQQYHLNYLLSAVQQFLFTPPHGPPGSGAGCSPPQAVLTRPVTALILYKTV